MSEYLTARDLTLALKGRYANGRGMARCPAHRDRTPSLSIMDGDGGRPVVHCFGGCNYRAVQEELQRLSLWPEDRQSRTSTVHREERRHDRHRQDRLAKATNLRAIVQLWNDAAPVEVGSLADRYLVGRGLHNPWPTTIRFGSYRTTFASHRSLIAAAQRWPGDHLQAVQITPLAEPGRKAWTKPARITRGSIGGAAVRLSAWEPGDAIVLVEGVEDGLAVLSAMPDAPVWAAVGAGNVAKVELPAGVELILALDGDAAGRKAAVSAVETLWSRGHRVRVAQLPNDRDPLDVLQGAGP